MKNRMRLAAAALALSMAGFGLTGCGGETKETAAKTEAADKIYRVQVGAFKSKGNAEKLVKELKTKGYQAIIV